MRFIFSLLFVLMSIVSFSQSKKDSFHYAGNFIGYEQKFFHDDFQRNIKSINNIESNSLPIESISIRFIGDIYKSRYTIKSQKGFPGYFNFSYILPSNIILHNSSEQKLRGFNFALSLAGQRFVNLKNFSLFLTEGVNLGRLKLVNNQNQKMKNMIIAPFVGLVTRLSISKFSLFAIAQYDYDISSKMWKKQWFHKGQDIHISGIRQSGLTLTAGVGFSLG